MAKNKKPQTPPAPQGPPVLPTPPAEVRTVEPLDLGTAGPPPAAPDPPAAVAAEPPIAAPAEIVAVDLGGDVGPPEGEEQAPAPPRRWCVTHPQIQPDPRFDVVEADGEDLAWAAWLAGRGIRQRPDGAEIREVTGPAAE